MKTIGRIIGLTLLSGIAITTYGKESGKMTDMKNPGVQDEKLQLTEKWDKIFPKSDKVDHCKITFHNRFGITLAADLYKPKNVSGKLPAIAEALPMLSTLCVTEVTNHCEFPSWSRKDLDPTGRVLGQWFRMGFLVGF